MKLLLISNLQRQTLNPNHLKFLNTEIRAAQTQILASWDELTVKQQKMAQIFGILFVMPKHLSRNGVSKESYYGCKTQIRYVRMAFAKNIPFQALILHQPAELRL